MKRKKNKRWNRIWIVLILLVCVAATVCGVGGVKGEGPAAFLNPGWQLRHLGGETLEVIEQKIDCRVNGQENENSRNIAGTLFLPDDGRTKRGIVVLAHGLNAAAAYNHTYIRALSEAGIAVYAFDFYGGSNWGETGGDTTRMTVASEIEELNCVVDMVKSWDWVDRDQIILFGESQGGLVAALTAARRTDIQGLVLFYPAFALPDIFRQRFGSMEKIPETFSYCGMTLGKEYCEELWDMNVYGEIEKYRGEVLIVHGTKDDVIPMTASEEAVRHFENARLICLRGAGHGFEGWQQVRAVKAAYDFVCGRIE